LDDRTSGEQDESRRGRLIPPFHTQSLSGSAIVADAAGTTMPKNPEGSNHAKDHLDHRSLERIR
jgi:hypothetical protein